VKLSDSHCAGIDANENVQMHIQRQLQMKGLTQLADPESVLHRYPQDMLMQRTFTFIPGAEAYTKDDEVQLDNETQQDKAISVRGGDVQVRQQDTGTASQQQGLIRFQTGSRIGRSLYIYCFVCLYSQENQPRGVYITGGLWRQQFVMILCSLHAFSATLYVRQ